jgi:hypothetical protein
MSFRINMRRSSKLVLLLVPLVVLGMFVSSSQGSWFNYKGATVNRAAAIPVAEGAHPVDYFVTWDLVIDYQYVRSGDQLDLWGSAQYGAGIRHNFKTVPRFYMRLYFADEKGMVLGYRGIVTSGYGYSDDTLRFKQRITLPPGTALMAFGYDGEARSTGEGKGASPFWFEPVSRW